MVAICSFDLDVEHFLMCWYGYNMFFSYHSFLMLNIIFKQFVISEKKKMF